MKAGSAALVTQGGPLAEPMIPILRLVTGPRDTVSVATKFAVTTMATDPLGVKIK
jgi:hypothetical protein